MVDYGGVLTTSVFESFRAFCLAEGLEAGALGGLLLGSDDLLAEAHRLELGQLEEAEFETLLAARLGVGAEGLLGRLFALSGPDEAMLGAVAAARRAGLPTGLLSNSWGLSLYPFETLAPLFDALVVSGEVGLRKPQPEIYLLAAERLGLAPGECVFVDDLRTNTTGARAVGMAGVLHRGAEGTIAELERLFGVRLR